MGCSPSTHSTPPARFSHALGWRMLACCPMSRMPNLEISRNRSTRRGCSVYAYPHQNHQHQPQQRKYLYVCTSKASKVSTWTHGRESRLLKTSFARHSHTVWCMGTCRGSCCAAGRWSLSFIISANACRAREAPQLSVFVLLC
jgi:hypothetical protein